MSRYFVQETVLRELLSSDTKVITLRAYPGFGKTYLALRLAREEYHRGSRKVLLVTKTHAEIEHIVSLAEAQNLRELIPLRGRGVLCPYASEFCTATTCMVLRTRAVCRLRLAVDLNAMSSLDVYSIPKKLNQYIQYCCELGMCPYELQWVVSDKVPIIVCTYSTLANPESWSLIVKLLERSRPVTIIMDEAHNVLLAESSTQLDVNALEHEIRGKVTLDPAIKDSLLELTYYLKRGDLGKAISLIQLSPTKLRREVQKVAALTSLRQLPNLLSILDDLLAAPSYACVLVSGSRVQIVIPKAHVLLKVLQLCDKVYLLSASLPMFALNFIGQVLNSQVKVVDVDAPSESTQGLKLVCVRGVTTKFSKRFSKRTIEVLMKILVTSINSSSSVGGRVVFFCSFDLMNYLLRRGLKQILDADTILEDSPNLDTKERVSLIEEFRDRARREKAVLLTSIHSILSEGVDFRGLELVEAILVGFPFSHHVDVLRRRVKYFRDLGASRPVLLALLLPAIAATVQAIGRLMRDTERIKKLGILVDERFYSYRKLLPKWIREKLVFIPPSPSKLAHIVFWTIGP